MDYNPSKMMQGRGTDLSQPTEPLKDAQIQFMADFLISTSCFVDFGQSFSDSGSPCDGNYTPASMGDGNQSTLVEGNRHEKSLPFTSTHHRRPDERLGPKTA